MADVPELHLVPNRCEIWSNSVNKKGLGGAIWTNLDVTSVIKRNDHIESCPVDEHLAYKMEKKALLKKKARKKRNPSRPFMMRKLPPHPPSHPHLAIFRSLNKTTKAGEDFLLWQCHGWHIQGCTTVVSTAVYHPCLLADKLVPAVYWLLPEYEVQGCYFHFYQAVHTKVGNLGLKTRYRTEEQTKRKIRMLLATAFLPVPQVDTGFRLLEAGTTEPITTWMEGWHNQLNRKAAKGHNVLYELLQILIAEQGVADTLIQQVLSGNATVGDLRRVNKVYAEKQQRVAQYTGEYTNGSRTLEQFLEALMYITPEPI
ncbi:hypothetical protein T09_13251 [Trichinella sp. T9]|nr:hypothetical protein T09_13251 [Trichinella sp. T9]